MKKSTNAEKFQHHYRIDSIRLPGYDYTSSGAYFVTICTKNREHVFGKILPDLNNAKIRLSNIGNIAADEWQKTAIIRDNIHLGAWVIMPNHIHGIICIENAKKEQTTRQYDGMHPGMSKISAKPHSLSTIIRFFKRQTTLRARKIYPDFAWQPRFYEHIIRDEKDFLRVTRYIEDNPRNWNKDEYR